jgi:hypothetical protein
LALLVAGDDPPVPTISLRYRFRQAFRASADEAFQWCTDFRSSDGALLSDRTKRTVRWLTRDAAILTDLSFPGGRRRRIRRLVRINTGQRAWTNTHLDGPFPGSQYWYRVVPDGRTRSHLEFEGFKLVEVARRIPPSEIDARARAERAGDSGFWRRSLAPALELDVRPNRPR